MEEASEQRERALNGALLLFYRYVLEGRNKADLEAAKAMVRENGLTWNDVFAAVAEVEAHRQAVED